MAWSAVDEHNEGEEGIGVTRTRMDMVQHNPEKCTAKFRHNRVINLPLLGLHHTPATHKISVFFRDTSTSDNINEIQRRNSRKMQKWKFENVMQRRLH